ncbi:MAG: hypothetical protein ABIH83_00215 [Candidatus Micrarchaeota archaeon]
MIMLAIKIRSKTTASAKGIFTPEQMSSLFIKFYPLTLCPMPFIIVFAKVVI